MALPPPLDSGGEGKQRVGAQSNGGGSSKPRGGKRELSERQAERSSGPLDETERCAVPSLSRPPLSPTSPAPPCHPAGTSQQKQTHPNPPHPEPLSEAAHNTGRRVVPPRDSRKFPHFNHVATRPVSSSRPALALWGGAQNRDAQWHQYAGVWQWHQYAGVCVRHCLRFFYV